MSLRIKEVPERMWERRLKCALTGLTGLFSDTAGFTQAGDSAGLLVPVWDFFGEYESDFGEGEKTGGTLVREEHNSFLTINAVDGTVINRESGY